MTTRSPWQMRLLRQALLLGAAGAAIAMPPVQQAGARAHLGVHRAGDSGEPIALLSHAERRCGAEAPQPVTLPNRALAVDAGPDPSLRCSYTLPLGAAQQGAGLFAPSVLARARLLVNGHEILDDIGGGAAATPRSADRLMLVGIPDEFWLAADNQLTVELVAERRVALSQLMLGPLVELRRLHQLRLLGNVIGPAVVAAVILTLGLCMLLLWIRRRDALFGYFGSAASTWALHTLWTVSPWSPLEGLHLVVWWTALYTLFVVLLIIFCLRYAEWRWPRVERALLVYAALSPMALYLADTMQALDFVDDAWRLGLIALVGLAVAAVIRASSRQPDLNNGLIVGAALVAFAFAVHDWLTNIAEGGNNPVYLVPYAGLLFVASVVRMLIDRFVHTTEQLEAMNTELGARVDSQNRELRHSMEQMRQARDEAEQANRAKSRFLAAASHDLRQPAHALALYMAALRAEPLEPAQAELIQRMSGSLAALEMMYGMLLDVSRIDAGGVQPAPRTFAIEPILRQLTDEFAPQADAQGLRLSLRLPVSHRPHACSDPALVERILRNLLGNALKYTVRGGVLVACRLGRARVGASPASPRAEPVWRIEVWDTGIGISPAQQSRVFEEFYQVDNPHSDRSKGLGLGLSIVDRLARLLGLPLSLRSRPGQGSCFALALPLAGGPGGEEVLGLSQDRTQAASVAGLTVAMIEDDLEVRDAMRALLQRWDCRVAAGATADELIADLAGQPQALAPPDALLLDQRLQEGRTGPAEAQRLYRLWRSRVPTLIVSGEADMAEVRSSGHDFLPKPVSAELLKRWLAAACRPPAARSAPREVP